MFFFLFIFCSLICQAQQLELERVERLLSEMKTDSAAFLIERINPGSWQEIDRAKYHYLKGSVHFSRSFHDLAFAELIEARKIFLSLDAACKIALTDLLILEVLSHQPNSLVPSQPFLDEFIEASSSCGNPVDEAIAYSKLAVVYLKVDDGKNALLYFDKAINLANALHEESHAINWTFNKGVVHNTTLKQYDSALYYFKLTAPFYSKNQNYENLSYNYNNQAEAYKKLGDYKTAIEFYRKADSIPLRRFNLKTKRIYYENIAEAYGKMAKYDSAYAYLIKLIKVKDTINEVSQNVNMAKIKEQYDNERLRADTLELDAKRTQNRNIALGLGGGLFAVSSIGLLWFKNSKRKQRIIEQQREIEIRKAEKLLKEQELATIDAMVEGQEKERERLASELHDSVGATLAAARMQFEYLKNNRAHHEDRRDLYETTAALLEDAYTEIRAMAHAKNDGVIAKNGLLPAVQKLVKNASVSKNLRIDLNYFGLNERLENSLEITLFRIIQELVTNIIKHSGASEAMISLTQLEDSLSVIVEDNGIGFEFDPLNSQSGMGLNNIERRVEKIEGSMAVDSTPGKGTTILIDIPI